MKSWDTYPIEADLSLSVAGCEVGLGLRRGALGTDSITHALVSALWLLSALLVTTLVRALSSTTRTLAGTGGKDKCSVKNFHKRAGRFALWNIKMVRQKKKKRKITSTSTCRLYWALICTSCCQPGWRHSSTGPCTDRCSHSHTPLLAPPGRCHRWAGQTLFGEGKINIESVPQKLEHAVSYFDFLCRGARSVWEIIRHLLWKLSLQKTKPNKYWEWVAAINRETKIKCSKRHIKQTLFISLIEV